MPPWLSPRCRDQEAYVPIPIAYYGTTQFYFCKLTYTPLIFLDINWEQFEPALAESWNYSDDGKQLTLNLRTDVTWHDGQPFTARDVDFTYKFMVRKEEYASVQDITIFEGGQEYKDRTTEEFAGLTVLDDYTVRLNLNTPFGLFLRQVSNVGILPAHNFPDDALTSDTGIEDFEAFTRNPIGTGPFKIKTMDPQVRIVWEANKEYFKGAPPLDGIEWAMGVTGAALQTGVRGGELDAASVAAQDAVVFRDLSEFRIESDYAMANLEILIVDYSKEWMNAQIVQALITAIDVEGIANTVRYGFAQKSSSIMNYPDLPDYSYNPERAKQLLAEGGWDPSRTLKYGLTAATPDPMQAQIINFWKDIGVETEVVVLDPANLVNIWQAVPRVYDVTYTDLAWTSYDPTANYSFFRCDRVGKGDYTSWCSESFDSLMLEAIRTVDPAEQRRLFQQAQVILATDLPYAQVLMKPDIWVFNQRMHGGNFKRGPMNNLNAELWWKES